MSDAIERKKLINWVKNLAHNHFHVIPKIMFNGRTHNMAFLSDICQFITEKFKYKVNPVEFLALTEGHPLALSIQRIKEPAHLAEFSILYYEKSPENISLSRLIALSIVDDFKSKRPFRATSTSKNSFEISYENTFELTDSESIKDFSSGNSSSNNDVIVQGSTSNRKLPQDNTKTALSKEKPDVLDKKSIVLDKEAKHVFILSGSDDESSGFTAPQATGSSTFKVANQETSAPLKRRAVDFSDSDDEIFKEFGTMTISKKAKTENDYDQSAIKVEVSELSNKFKSPLTPNVTVNKTSIEDKIDYSFANSPVLSMDTFQMAYCAVNGAMFNYKNEKCAIPSHFHPSLSKFLKCFPSVIESKQYRKMYLINKTKRIDEINKKRLPTYTKKAKANKHKACIEALVTTFFGYKATLNLDDFINAFNYVYKRPFSQLCNNSKPADYLSNLQSPNIVLVKKDGEYNLTVTPFNSSTYKDYGTFEARKFVEEFEKSLCATKNSDIGCDNNNSIAYKLLSFSNPDIPDTYNELFKIADLNIPKSVQMSKDAENFEYKNISLAKYLKSCINFSARHSM